MKTYQIFDESKAKDFVASVLEKSQIFLGMQRPEGAVCFRMVITTETVDRTGEVVKLDGWDTENYMKNPVVLFAHDYHSLPVGITTNLYVQDGEMIAEGYFASEDANPLAGQLAKLYQAGLMRTCSVGFIPTYSRTDSTVIEKAELLEWSFVPVPANPQALTLLSIDMQKEFVTKGLLIEEKADTTTPSTITPTDSEDAPETVQEELDEREAEEMKWERYMEAAEIMSAFYDVYFDENTPVENFDTLLKETIGLLSALIGTDTTESTEAKELLIAAKKEVIRTEKAGRVLSDKSKKHIQGVIDGIEESCGKLGTMSKSLTELLSLAEEEKSADELLREKESGDELVQAVLKSRKVLKGIATVVNDALASANASLSNKK